VVDGRTLSVSLHGAGAQGAEGVKGAKAASRCCGAEQTAKPASQPATVLYRLDGSCTPEERREAVNWFSSAVGGAAAAVGVAVGVAARASKVAGRRSAGGADTGILLISTRAGGEGLTLTHANRVVILDCAWNPSHDVQACCRCYRLGQRKPVFTYRLVTAGGMDETVLSLQVRRLCTLALVRHTRSHPTRSIVRGVASKWPNSENLSPQLMPLLSWYHRQYL
jgi:hypothetical protein